MGAAYRVPIRGSPYLGGSMELLPWEPTGKAAEAVAADHIRTAPANGTFSWAAPAGNRMHGQHEEYSNTTAAHQLFSPVATHVPTWLQLCIPGLGSIPLAQPRRCDRMWETRAPSTDFARNCVILNEYQGSCLWMGSKTWIIELLSF